jgi:large subunit ribosomal protein L4
MTINILNQNGENTGRSVELPSNIFGIEPNEHVLYLAVKQYLAHQRQGTHKTKERSEKAGSTRKLKKQKGTGGARAGDINSPTRVGGGRAFGPRPRTYTLKLNKKVKALARKSALAAKAHAGQVVVVEDFTFATPTTKGYKNFLAAINANTKSLHMTAAVDNGLVLSSRNLQKVSVTTAVDFNVYEVLNANCLIINESTIAALNGTFAGE